MQAPASSPSGGLVAAGKYTPLPAARPAAPRAQARPPAHSAAGSRASRGADPVTQAARSEPRWREWRGQVVVARLGRELPLHEWFWKALKDGGYLYQKLARERAETERRMARVGRRHRNRQRNLRSDLNLRAVMDSRTYFRWKQTDPDYFQDDANLKRFLRDNPAAEPWKH